MKNKACVLVAPKTLEIQEVPMPQLFPGYVLVKINVVGICGSDIHYYANGRIGDFVVKYPFILGHECSGSIIQVGEGVTSLKVGDRVALEPGIPCNKCEMCKTGHYNLCSEVMFFATPPVDGCLMNYVAFPEEFAFKLPENVTDIEGALVEPLAIGLNASITGGVKLGDTVVIFGAGCIGLVSLLAAKAYGATKVIVVDILPKRLHMAEKLGAIALNSKECNIVSEINLLTEGKWANVVIDCAGFSTTIKSSIKVVRPTGSVVIVGMGEDIINGIPLGPISTKEVKITSIFRYKNLYPVAIQAIAEKRIDIEKIVSNRFHFEDTPIAYQTTYENASDTVKSIIMFD